MLEGNLIYHFPQSLARKFINNGTGSPSTVTNSSIDSKETFCDGLFISQQGPEKLLTFLQTKTSQKENLPHKTIGSKTWLGCVIGASIAFRVLSSGQ